MYKDQILRVRASDGQKAAIEHAAGREGITVSRFMRRAALNAAGLGALLTSDDGETLAELTYHLAKIGTNLNQIAYDLNLMQSGGPAVGSLDTTLRLFADAIDQHNRILETIRPVLVDLEAEASRRGAALCKEHPAEV